MTLITDPHNLPDSVRGGAVSIGNFDGVHLGHAEIARALVGLSQRVDGPAIVLTFDPHPAQLLRPGLAPPALTTLPQRAVLLAELGVAAVVAYPTTPSLLAKSPEVFFEEVLIDALEAQALVEGENFRFGRDRQGDITTLKRLGKQHGLLLEIAQPVEVAEERVSSSRIRHALAAGDVAGAVPLLGRPYRLVGTVVRGAQRGRTIGFPTANLGALATVVPAPGVYAGRTLLQGAAFPVAVNVGTSPTFGEERSRVEAHIIGWEGDLYGQELAVDFSARLRDIAAYPSPDALVAQLQKDVEKAKEVFAAGNAK